jgi:1,2-diacylglycerol 3-alpha-glucosyltransferase
MHELGIQSHVTFVGKVPIEDVPYYYHLGDVYVSASITETQGLTFMEAMASSTIVLCRFDENLASLITHQKTGFFVDRWTDIPSMLHTIFSLTKTQHQTIIRQAMAAVDYYSLDTFYENLKKVYIRALRQYW